MHFSQYRRYTPYLLIIIAFALTACNGDINNSADTPTDPDLEFSLHVMQPFDEGTVYQSDFVGTASIEEQSIDFKGNIAIINGKPTLLDDETVTPKILRIKSIIEGSQNESASTRFYNSEGYIVQISDNSNTPIICLPSTYEKYPDTVKIGDSGYLPSYNCSNNETQSGTWRAEDGKNGNLLFIESVEYRSETEQVLSTEEITYTLNTTGHIIGISFVVKSDIANIIINTQ